MHWHHCSSAKQVESWLGTPAAFAGEGRGNCPPELRRVGLIARPDHELCPGAQEAKTISLPFCELLGSMEPTGSDGEDGTLLRYARLS